MDSSEITDHDSAAMSGNQNSCEAINQDKREGKCIEESVMFFTIRELIHKKRSALKSSVKKSSKSKVVWQKVTK